MYNRFIIPPMKSSNEPVPVLTEELLKHLLLCKKKIVAKPNPNRKSNLQHKETEMSITSIDGLYNFSVRIREHSTFFEKFSIILLFIPSNDVSQIILRYNGDHGEHTNRLVGDRIHCPHIHRYNFDYIEAGLDPMKYAIPTNKYSSTDEALELFFKDLNVVNYLDYYPHLSQTTIPLK